MQLFLFECPGWIYFLIESCVSLNWNIKTPAFPEDIQRQHLTLRQFAETCAFLPLVSVWCSSSGRTSCYSQRQWRVSIQRSRQPCRPPSSSNRFIRSIRSNKSSRWPRQHRPSKSSCPPNSSKVGFKEHLCIFRFLKLLPKVPLKLD